MPRRVIVVELCDLHKDDQPEVPATWNKTISINNLTRELMLCEEHRQKVIGMLEDVLMTYGTKPAHVKPPKKHQVPAPSAALVATVPVSDERPVIKGKRRDTPKPCPAKGCDFVSKSGG
jgi:hypothetical protein